VAARRTIRIAIDPETAINAMSPSVVSSCIARLP
jgi:hypothetical protein